jgi:DNA-binding CsgD family transcriptional regulator
VAPSPGRGYLGSAIGMAGDRGGPLAFLVFRDGSNQERTFAFDPNAERVRIGRGAAADVRLGWDRQVSRIHAELERLGDGWALIDDGLSANGTHLNGERLLGRRRLSSGDRIGVGTTSLTFRTVADDESRTFIPALDAPPVALTRLQREVLIALCRPYRAAGSPATNQQIADELHVSIAAVKTHLRALFEKLAIAGLPQNQKRARLVVLALERGLISERDLAE